MIKQGIVKPGSPSAVSSKPSTMVKKGEAIRPHEKVPRGPESLRGQIPLESDPLEEHNVYCRLVG
jgi:hypothetical protein